MNPELKEKWLEALRSGKYEQGQGRLACEGHFCCLGVLVEVAQAWHANDPTHGHLNMTWRTEHAGLDDNTESNLIDMNDVLSCDFPEIADWIEKNL